MTSSNLIDLEDIRATAERISPYVLHTPIVPMADCGVLLKAESLQASGAFKLRGAFNSMLSLDETTRGRGVIAHSSGNHAIAVAYAGTVLGIPTTIVMPEDAPALKLSRTRSLGAEVIVVGPASAERTRHARQLADERGLWMIEPYDSREVLSATAGISIEILKDLPKIVASNANRFPPPAATPNAGTTGLEASLTVEIYVPISGGGLAGGVAAGAKLTNPDVRVIGVEPEVAADALASWQAGEPVALPGEQMSRTIADGLRVQRVGNLNWPHLRAFLDDIVTVSEEQIRDAMRSIASESRLVAEPSGAVAAAAAITAAMGDSPAGVASKLASKPTGSETLRIAVLTGGNVDPDLYAEILRGGIHP